MEKVVNVVRLYNSETGNLKPICSPDDVIFFMVELENIDLHRIMLILKDFGLKSIVKVCKIGQKP